MENFKTIINSPKNINHINNKLESPKSPRQYFKKIIETDKDLLITDLSSTNIQLSIPLKIAKEFLINFFCDQNTKTQFLTYGSVAQQLSKSESEVIEKQPSDIDILCIHYSLVQAVSDFKQILNKLKIPHVNQHELAGNKISNFIIQLQGQNYNLSIIDHVQSKIAYPPNFIGESQYKFTSENWENINLNSAKF